jgi:hypothetical protein
VNDVTLSGICITIMAAKRSPLHVLLQTQKVLFMLFYYFIFTLMALCIIVALMRSVILRRKNIPVELFIEALRNENTGQFEKAVVVYENALKEFKKIGFHGSLKNKIIEKIKLLHTFIEYQKNSVFIR